MDVFETLNKWFKAFEYHSHLWPALIAFAEYGLVIILDRIYTTCINLFVLNKLVTINKLVGLLELFKVLFGDVVIGKFEFIHNAINYCVDFLFTLGFFFGLWHALFRKTIWYFLTLFSILFYEDITELACKLYFLDHFRDFSCLDNFGTVIITTWQV